MPLILLTVFIIMRRKPMLANNKKLYITPVTHIEDLSWNKSNGENTTTNPPTYSPPWKMAATLEPRREWFEELRPSSLLSK